MFNLETFQISFGEDKRQKLSNQSTSFLVGAFPVIQGGNHSILKNHPGVRVGVGWVEIWP